MGVPHPSTKPGPKNALQCFSLFFRGLLMGAADIVPGVSGGTIAFVTGIYEDLLAGIKSFDMRAIASLLSLRLPTFFRSVAWEFILCLGLGVAVAMVSIANIFTYLLGHEVYYQYLYAGFLGLILGSIVFCARQVDKWGAKCVTALIIGGGCAFLFTGMEPGAWNSENRYDVAVLPQSLGQELEGRHAQNYHHGKDELLNVSESSLVAMMAKGVIDGKTAVYSHHLQKSGKASDFVHSHSSFFLDGWIFFCGALAVCAMLLPGVSGSYLLNILGMYGLVIGALADFTKNMKNGFFDESSFAVLFSLFLGVVAGGLLFSRVVIWLFEHHRQIAMSSLIGFMIGALRSVWPFWAVEYHYHPLKLAEGPKLHLTHPVLPETSQSTFWVAMAIVACGFLFVMALEFASHRKNKSKQMTEKPSF